jgi:hypothetical protein
VEVGQKRLDDDDLKLIGGMVWPLRRGEEVGLGCGEVWVCSGNLYIGPGSREAASRWETVQWPVVRHNSVQMGEGRRPGVGYWRGTGEEAKRRRFPCVGGGQRHPWLAVRSPIL